MVVRTIVTVYYLNFFLSFFMQIKKIPQLFLNLFLSEVITDMNIEHISDSKKKNKKAGVSIVLNWALQFFKSFLLLQNRLITSQGACEFVLTSLCDDVELTAVGNCRGLFSISYIFIPLKHRSLSTRPVQSRSTLIHNYCFNSKNRSGLMIQTELLIQTPLINVVIQKSISVQKYLKPCVSIQVASTIWYSL